MTGAPDVAGAVVGWRVWRVEASGRRVRLRSGVRDTVWPPARATRARCTAAHLAPGPTCGCGLYAVTEPAAVMGLGAVGGVLGLAALWGEVIEGTGGWRSSAGAPVFLLTDPSVGPETRRLLVEVYRVPVHPAPMPLARLIPLLSGRLRPAADQLRADLEAAVTRGALPSPPSPAVRRILEARPAPGDRSIVASPVGPVSRWAVLPATVRVVVALVMGGLAAVLLGGWFGSTTPQGGLWTSAVLVMSAVALVVVVVFTGALVALSLDEGLVRTRVAVVAGCSAGTLAVLLYGATAVQTAMGWRSWMLLGEPSLLEVLRVAVR